MKFQLTLMVHLMMKVIISTWIDPDDVIRTDEIPKNQFPTDTNLTGQDPIEIPKNLKNIFSPDENEICAKFRIFI